MTNLPMNNFTFHNAITTTGLGTELSVASGYQSVNVEIVSTGTVSVTFEGKGLSGAWYPVAGINLNTFDMNSTVTDKTVLYQIDLTALVAFRCKLTANTGNTTISGKVVG